MVQSNGMRLMKAINNKDWSHPGARKYLEDVRRQYRTISNKEIKKRKKEFIPEIVVTTKLLKKMNYVANKISSFGKGPLEIYCTCSGQTKIKEGKTTHYLTDLHIFEDQKVSAISAEVSGRGQISTYLQLKHLGKGTFFDCHSHNKMPAFHSKIDDDDLERKIQVGAYKFKGKTCSFGKGFGSPFYVPYNISVVFNQFTQSSVLSSLNKSPWNSDKCNFYIKAGLKLPEWDNGFKLQNVEFFEPSYRILNNGNSLYDFEREKLDCAIKDHVYWSGKN